MFWVDAVGALVQTDYLDILHDHPDPNHINFGVTYKLELARRYRSEYLVHGHPTTPSSIPYLLMWHYT
jgi:hypothetical protein